MTPTTSQLHQPLNEQQASDIYKLWQGIIRPYSQKTNHEIPNTPPEKWLLDDMKHGIRRI